MEQSAQPFSMKWSDYHTHLSAQFQDLRTNEHFTDVTLYSEGQKIRAHQMILAACSPYFAEVLHENSHPNPLIIFRDVKFNDLALIVQFMYNGEVSVAQEMLMTFLQTAEMLKIRGLADKSQPKPQPQPTNTTTVVEPIEVQVKEELEDLSESSMPLPVTEYANPACMVQVAYEVNPPVEEEEEEEQYQTFDTMNDFDDPMSTEEENLQSAMEMQFYEGDSSDPLPVDQEPLEKKIRIVAKIKKIGYQTTQIGIPQRSKVKKHQCPTCGKWFVTTTALADHKRMHEGLTKCHLCDHVSSKIGNLKRHIRNKHMKELVNNEIKPEDGSATTQSNIIKSDEGDQILLIQCPSNTDEPV